MIELSKQAGSVQKIKGKKREKVHKGMGEKASPAAQALKTKENSQKIKYEKRKRREVKQANRIETDSNDSSIDQPNLDLLEMAQ